MNENIPYIERLVDLNALLAKKSHFLLGPRQTGKTFLIRQTLDNARVYDLLDSETYLSLRALEKNNSTSCLPVVPSPAFHPPAHIPICAGGCALATNPHSAPYFGIIYFHDPKALGGSRFGMG